MLNKTREEPKTTVQARPPPSGIENTTGTGVGFCWGFSSLTLLSPCSGSAMEASSLVVAADGIAPSALSGIDMIRGRVSGMIKGKIG